MKSSIYIYGLSRISSLSQKDNTSLSFQKKRIEDYCKVYDYKLVDILVEMESGGKDVDERSGLSKLKSLIESGHCDTIIVNKIDRLGRSLLQGLLFLKYCEEYDCRVISISESIDTDNPSSKLITNILFSIAENERDMIKSRLSDGRKRTFEDGKKPYGNISYGYRKNNKGEIVIDNYDAKVVSFIFKKMNSYLKNNSLTKKKRTIRILKLLTKNGYKFNGKDFKYWNVNTILSNSIYCGWLKWKDQIVKSSYPAIVSKRLFNTVQIT